MPLRWVLGLGLVGKSAAGSIQSLCASHTHVQVEPMVNSGTPNPVFTMEGPEFQTLCSIVLQESNDSLTLPTCRVLGFTGWKLCPGESAEDCVVLRGNPAADIPLFTALSLHIPDYPAEAKDHIMEELARLHQSNGGDTQCADEKPLPSPSNGWGRRRRPSTSCRQAPIVGPDDATQVHYDPSHDDDGCFITEQSCNNCYDYANDVVTNTFAQPGRGSGVCPPDARPCVKNTCEDVKNAAISDGLQWVGTELPTSLPSKGHYVSLHIWPNSNFHWIRMDADKYWSHKPGGTRVRNVDNDYKKITDPGKANFAPWTQHCGYMLAIPSDGRVTETAFKSSIMV